MKTKLMHYLCIVLLVFTAPFAYASSPDDVVKASANKLMASLEKNKSRLKSHPTLVNELIEEHIIPEVDVVGMSRSVLGREAWKNATAKQRKEFSHEFMKLVVRTYSTGLRNYSGEKIKFYPVRAGSDKKGFATVSCLILVPNGRQIPLKYRLVKKHEGWKVYDISVEGVSLLQSFHNQFSQEMKKGISIDELIVKIRHKKVRQQS